MKTLFKRPESLTDVATHYCPGCTHGIAHRLIAEVIDELGLRERAVGIAPVGCSVLAFNYFNMDFQQAAHGRAPALATGIKRARPDLITFTYQGDGDLASIGMAEIIHAANRGEKFTVVFINNAVYGMTGGQMAPTTMPGQVTTTSPKGRDVNDVGYPIRMCELLASLRTPGFIERVAVHTPQQVVKARRVLKTAFELQRDSKCFTFVEVLSTCPTNWGMTPLEATKWLQEHMVPYYPIQNFKKFDGEESPRPKPQIPKKGAAMQVEAVFAGFGGQGVMLAGKLLAEVGMSLGKEVVWLPSYGPEMRGGTANCTVIIADQPIASPIVSNPRDTVVMNRPSLERFCPAQKGGGFAVVNTSLITVRPERKDVVLVEVPANQIAIDAGTGKAANMVMLGAYVGATGLVPFDAVVEMTKHEFQKKAKVIPVNVKCLEAGFQIGKAAAKG